MGHQPRGCGIWQGESRMTDEPVQTFASVWDTLEETPETAANMRLRSEPAIAVCDAVGG